MDEPKRENVPPQTEADYEPADDPFLDTPRAWSPLSAFPSKRSAIPALILFLIFYIVSSLSVRNSLINELAAQGDALFRRHELWRAVTALAVHADIVHLLSNGIVLFFFGWMLHFYFGYCYFPVLSLFLGIATNLAVTALSDQELSIIGCSGMTYGMVSLWIVLYIKHDTAHSPGMRILRALGFLLALFFPSALEANVSYLSHLIGFVMGVLIGLASLPFSRVLPRPSSSTDEGSQGMDNEGPGAL